MLFRSQDNTSLHMVNEVSRAVFHSDYRIYDRVNENLKAGSYHNLKELINEVKGYTQYLKGKERSNER